MSNSIPTPPADNSGGFFVIKYTNGLDTHRMRHHFGPVTRGATGPNGGALFSYVTPPTESGASATVQDDMTKLMNAVAGFLSTAWTLSVDALWTIQAQNGQVIESEEFGWDRPNPVTSTSGTPATSALQRAGEFVFSTRTSQGGRYRLIIIGSGNWAANTTGSITTAHVGDANINFNLAGIVCGPTTGLVAHDGYKPQLPLHLTAPYNSRLRRKYGQA